MFRGKDGDRIARMVLTLAGEEPHLAALPMTVFVILPSGNASTLMVSRDDAGWLYATDAPALN